MKVLMIALTCVFCMLSVSALAADECLRRAANQDILDELNRRLSGGTTTSVALASYNCDNFGDMMISLVGPTGIEKTAKVTVHEDTNCDEQATALRASRAKIIATATAGVCDNFGDLHRFSMTPNGDLVTLTTSTLHDMQSCLQKAGQMNQRH